MAPQRRSYTQAEKALFMEHALGIKHAWLDIARGTGLRKLAGDAGIAWGTFNMWVKEAEDKAYDISKINSRGALTSEQEEIRVYQSVLLHAKYADALEKDEIQALVTTCIEQVPGYAQTEKAAAEA
eukprot:jgi/Tetstr1/447593/TSEL_003745.t1